MSTVPQCEDTREYILDMLNQFAQLAREGGLFGLAASIKSVSEEHGADATLARVSQEPHRRKGGE